MSRRTKAEPRNAWSQEAFRSSLARQTSKYRKPNGDRNAPCSKSLQHAGTVDFDGAYADPELMGDDLARATEKNAL